MYVNYSFFSSFQILQILSLQTQQLKVLQISDIHGYIYNDHTNINEGTIGTLVSYYERLNNQYDTLLIDGGDDCEGTALSNIDPRCHIIYDTILQVPFTYGILGNHDLSYTQQTEYLSQVLQNNNTHNGWISTNIFNSTTNKPFSDQYKLIKTKQGMNVLAFGYMYTSNNDYENLYVSSLEDASDNINIENIIDPYQIDLMIISAHIGFETPSLHKIYQYWRDRFLQQYNYTVPILLIAAHDHQKIASKCSFLNKNDTQCFMIDAGSYMKYINQIDIVCDEIQIEFQNQSFQGSQCNFTSEYQNISFTYENIASRFNLTPETFDTQWGKQIQNFVEQNVNQYQIFTEIAFSKYQYQHSAQITEESSMQRLWDFSIFNSLIQSEKMKNQTNCTQFPVTRTALTRSNVLKGAQTLESLTNSMPFTYEIQVIQNLSKQEAKCVFQYLNTGMWNFDVQNDSQLIDLIEIFTQNTEFFYTAQNLNWDQKCYDFVMNSYEVPRAQLAYQLCDINETYVKNKTYETQSGIQFTSELFQEFWKQFMNQIEYTFKQTIDYQTATFYESIVFIILYVILIICIIVAEVRDCRRIKGQYTRIDQQ